MVRPASSWLHRKALHVVDLAGHPGVEQDVAVEPRADRDRRRRRCAGAAGDAPAGDSGAPAAAGRRSAGSARSLTSKSSWRTIEKLAVAGDPGGNVGLAARRPLGDGHDLAGERRGGRRIGDALQAPVRAQQAVLGADALRLEVRPAGRPSSSKVEHGVGLPLAHDHAAAAVARVERDVLRVARLASTRRRRERGCRSRRRQARPAGRSRAPGGRARRCRNRRS